MADFLPWFPFDFDAFIEGTPAWNWEERGAYLSLLREQWRAGYIPNAPTRLHHFINGMSPARFRKMWAERIAAKFQPVVGHPDRLVNARMAEDRADAERRNEQKVLAGKARAARSSGSGNGGAAGSDGGRGASTGATAATAPLAKCDNKEPAERQQPLDTENMITSSYEQKASLAGERAGDAGEGPETEFDPDAPLRSWTDIENAARQTPIAPHGFPAAEFDALWWRVTESPSGDSSQIIAARDLCLRSAALQKPPADPLAHAEALVLANVEMVADWAARGEHHGAPTLAKFVEPAHFAKVVRWAKGERPGQKKGAKQPQVKAAEGLF